MLTNDDEMSDGEMVTEEVRGRGQVTVSDAVCNYKSIKRRRESRQVLGGTIDTLHICLGAQITVTPIEKRTV